jgi:fructose-1,6-bisphosphatase/inositol monophosphatase family enzyme
MVRSGEGYRRRVSDDELLGALGSAALAVRKALSEVDDWRPSTERAGQYHIDVVTDAAAVEVLVRSGLGVLSEESGAHHPDRDVVVVLDPVDGSTNASRGLPWYATSLCAVDAEGPRAAVVVNQASGEHFEAVRGGGARCDGRPMRASGCQELGSAMVAVSGLPSAHWGWAQFRALGAAALDLCYVADGRLDGYVDAYSDAHGPWDYLGGLLVCQEAGAEVVDAQGRSLVVLDHGARRTPVAAATPALLEQLVAAVRSPAGGR